MMLLRIMLALLLSWTLAGRAETINELIERGIGTNPELKFYESEIEAARAGRRTAAQLSNPELSLERADRRIRSSSDDPLGNGTIWRAEIMQTFEFPGRISLRKAIADHDLGLAELGLQQFKAMLANHIRKQAGDLVLLRRQAEATRAVRDRIEGVVAVLVQRDNGTISAKLERRMLEASLLTHDHALTEVEKTASGITATLNLLCARPPEAVLHISGDLMSLPRVPDLGVLKSQAARGNFELLQKQVQLQRQGLKVDLTKSERWGNIKFGPYIAGEKHLGEDEKSLGLSFSVPLPLWNRSQGQIAAEQARQAGAQAMLASTLRDLERDLFIQRQSYASELEALSRWNDQTENEFRTAAEEADQHYRLGAVSAATYLEMQRGYLEALTSLIETRRQAWQHRMELERLTGTSLESKP